MDRSSLRVAVELEELSAVPVLALGGGPDIVGFGQGKPSGVNDDGRLNQKAILV